MPPHNIVPLHRGVRPIPPAHLERIFDDVEPPEPITFGDIFNHIGDALGSRGFLLFYAGFWFGCLVTVGAAFVLAGLGL
jgi:hypothetical protein